MAAVTTPATLRQPSSMRRRQTGISLVELMVAIAIGLFLLAGITALISQQSSARAELDKSSRQIESGRYAYTLLQDDIEHAGYYGRFGGTMTASSVMPNPCSVVQANLDDALALPLQGYDAPTSVPAPLSDCLADANHVPGTDILVTRRLETGDVLASPSTGVAGQVYVQTTPADKKIGIGPDPTPAAPSTYTLVQKDATTPAPLWRYLQSVYFISPCNRFAAGTTVCTSAADGGKPVPTLKRLELTTSGGAPAFVITPLVDGIQNMQLDFGVDAIGAGTPAVPFIAAPALADWPNVMAVQISLLARNTDATAGYSDTKTYSMGSAGSVGPFADAYKRHVYTGTVRVTNPSSRRE